MLHVYQSVNITYYLWKCYKYSNDATAITFIFQLKVSNTFALH